MSLILDALKKMEQEKARRRTTSVALGPAIVREQAVRSSSTPKTALLVIAAVVVTAGLTALVMSLFPVGSGTPPRETVAEEALSTSSPGNLPKPPSTIPATPTIPSPSPVPPQAATPAPVPTSVPAPVAHPAPELTVSGIAWQEEASARRAVVNGVLVAEGATVAGVVVRQIHPDHVIFSSGGRSMTVSNSSPFH